MMKVICIDNTAPCDKRVIGKFHPIEGNIYTVTKTVYWYGYNWYLLAEDDGGNGWNPKYFIPLSKIENKILKYETETV